MMKLPNGSGKEHASTFDSITNVSRTEWLKSCHLTFKFAIFKFYATNYFYVQSSMQSHTENSLKSVFVGKLKSTKGKTRYDHVIKK